MNQFKSNISMIFGLAVPIIIENILQTLLGTADTYFAGQLTDHAIAGIGLTNMIMNIFIAFFVAISVGTGAVVSRNYGAKIYEQTNRSIVQSIIVGLGLGLSVGAICLLFHEPILRLAGADETVLEYAAPYYLVVAVPCVFLCLQQILSSCLRAIKDTKTPMYSTGLANLINIVLDYVFIKMGLGVVGLALATTIARLIAMCLLFYKLQHHDEKIYFKKEHFNIDKESMVSILTIGIPAGTEKLIMRTGQLLYNSMIISIGVNSYVAHNIAGTIESYSYLPAMGFGMAISTLVGNSLGEKDEKKAVSSVCIGYGISAVCMTILGAGFYIFAPTLAALFTETREVQQLVVDVLRIIALAQPFCALVQVMTSALQGAGDTRFPMYSTLIGIWGIRLCIGYTLAIPYGLGLRGVWIAYASDMTVRGILLLIRFYRGKWKRIKV